MPEVTPVQIPEPVTEVVIDLRPTAEEVERLNEEFRQRRLQQQGVKAGGSHVTILQIRDREEISWQEKALCAQTDPEEFFPEKGGSNRMAKLVCARCDVRVECLEDALVRDDRFGIAGGLSERERRRLKKASQ